MPQSIPDRFIKVQIILRRHVYIAAQFFNRKSSLEFLVIEREKVPEPGGNIESKRFTSQQVAII